MSLARRARPFVALFLLALVAFWPLVLHPTETLYSNTSDLLAEHLPAKMFLVRSLRETGEVPLWNPEQYCGSPFVHDIQVGLFYPPHLPLYFISEPAVGPFLSWLVFAHVVSAGWFMYAYSRHAGMTELAAFVAGVGFMLSPRWMMQLFLAGHTVTQGICWLPLVLLCVERAIQRGRWSWAIGGGVAYAMLILGTHPQWTFYASLLIGAWPLRLVYEQWQASLPRKRGEEPGLTQTLLAADYGEPGCVSEPPPPAYAGGSLARSDESLSSSRTLLVRWFLVEAVVVLIGLGLCAVQLLPTIEAAGQSSRAKGMGQSWSLDGAKAAMGTLIGPFPDNQAEPIHWETRGGIGFTWAVMALVGARCGGRRQLVPIIIALAMLAYALGGSYFIDRLPGFNNFRMPTRMLLTFAFAVAWFAGLGVQSLINEVISREVRVASLAVLIVLLNFVTIGYLGGDRVIIESNRGKWIMYWLAIPVFWGWFLHFGIQWPSRSRTRFAIIVMVLDVVAITCPFARTKSVAEIYPRSPIIDYIRENNTDDYRVMDGWDDPFNPRWFQLGPGSPGASVFGVPSVLGYNPVDVARYRQFLAFLAGIGEPQMAFSGDFTHPVVLPFRIERPGLRILLGEAYWIEERVAQPAGVADGFDPDLTDPHPKCYNFLTAGVQELPAMELWKTQDPLGRAFVVNEVSTQAPEFGVLSQLESIDVRRTATLEDWDPATTPLPQSNSPPGPAKIQSHKPNEIRIALDGHTAGLLVLTDPWYPGWVCRVDGNEVPIWKADYAFRGVMVPDGSREVVFHFEPQSYRRGKWISIVTLALVIGYFAVRLRPVSRRNKAIAVA